MSHITEEKLARLLARKLSGEISATELQELNDWVNNNPGDQFFSELLSSYWQGYSPPLLVNKTADEHFEHILKTAGAEEKQLPVAPAKMKLLSRKGKIYWLKISAVAAMLIGIVFGSIILFKNKSGMAISSPTEVAAAPGARSQMQLPDGSKVWLNSDSKLKFDQNFNNNIREVFIEGEAYFDVVKDANRPFVVHTSAIDIRVLGTSFNVKSYSAEKTIETTLINGMIEVTDRYSTPSVPKIILRPKEKLVFVKYGQPNTHTGSSATVHSLPAFSISALPERYSDSSFAETSWKYNRLIFEGETFSELALKMERWFNVKIVIKNPAVAGYRLRGMFEDETIEQALQALQVIAPFRYKINENMIEITK